MNEEQHHLDASLQRREDQELTVTAMSMRSEFCTLTVSVEVHATAPWQNINPSKIDRAIELVTNFQVSKTEMVRVGCTGIFDRH